MRYTSLLHAGPELHELGNRLGAAMADLRTSSDVVLWASHFASLHPQPGSFNRTIYDMWECFQGVRKKHHCTQS